MLTPEDSSVLWLLVVGFIVAFILAFGIGANDVANSFGTSVGAKVLTLKQACIIASIFELAGAILIGSKVSDTVRKGIIDINAFTGYEELAMAGAFSALVATSVWLIVATFFNLPVSGTHSIVGATIGYSLVAIGPTGINWVIFGKIAASWVVSPLLSGLVSSIIFVLIDKLILETEEPLKHGMRSLPFLFGGTIFINIFSIFLSNSSLFGMGSWAWYSILGVSAGAALVLALILHFAISPWLRRRIINTTKLLNKGNVQCTFADGHEAVCEVKPTELHTSFSNPASFTQSDENANLPGTKEKESHDNPAMELETNIEEEERNKTVSESLSVPDQSLEQPKRLYSQSMLVPSRIENGDGKQRSLTFAPDDGKPSSVLRLPSGSVRSTRSHSLREVMKTPDEPVENARLKVEDDPHSAQLFKYLQILTASFGAFAHGGNDVSNAIGPVISLYLIYKYGVVISSAATPIWILIYGGVGIIVGLSVWGRRVIKTIGENLSPITPTSGFCIEIGSALTVLLASNLGIPISTTHCKVGSVVIVGRVRSKEVVNWDLFRNIVISWVVTMPVTGGISAAVFAIVREALK